MLAHFCLLLVFVALHRDPGVPALLVAMALPAIWGCFLRQQKRPNEQLEIMADFFALVHLAREADFRTAIARIARQFRNRAEDVRFAGRRARLLVGRAQILSRKRSFRWGQGVGWSEQMVLLVPPWLGFLLLGGMLWLGAVLSITEWEEVLSVSVIWVVIPALVQCYRFVLTAFAPEAYMPYSARARRQARAFLEVHAPSDLPAERHVKLLDLV